MLAYRYTQVQDDAGDTAADGDDGTASTVGATRQPRRPSGEKGKVAGHLDDCEN